MYVKTGITQQVNDYFFSNLFKHIPHRWCHDKRFFVAVTKLNTRVFENNEIHINWQGNICG